MSPQLSPLSSQSHVDHRVYESKSFAKYFCNVRKTPSSWKIQCRIHPCFCRSRTQVQDARKHSSSFARTVSSQLTCWMRPRGSTNVGTKNAGVSTALAREKKLRNYHSIRALSCCAYSIRKRFILSSIETSPHERFSGLV